MRPILCFLHGYDEGGPVPIGEGLTRHGPLADTSSSRAVGEFIVVAAQMPTRGDLWYRYADAVREIVEKVRERYGGDSRQTFLTGFSFGGNGVFDLALQQPGLWTALWPVDPTRVPKTDPKRPVWLSSGQISRNYADDFIERLRLEPLRNADPGDRVYVDQNQDHVGTARRAYRDDRVYEWLLSKR